MPPLKQMAIPQWDEVEADLQALKAQAPFFLELFAGEAGITEAVHLQGISVLPPVDITPGKLVQQPKDILDLQFWKLVLDILAMASCSSCTVAHRATRSRQLASSMAGHRHFDRQRLHWVWTGSAGLISYWFFLGNLFLERTVEACVLVFLMLVGIS